MYFKSWVSTHCTNIWMQIQNYKERLKSRKRCEQEKRIKTVPLLHLKWLLFFSFVDTVLVWNILSKGKRQIIRCVFFSLCVCTCAILYMHMCTLCYRKYGFHACTMHREHSTLVWGEAFWHEPGEGRLLKGRCFLRPERYFLRTNTYLKGPILHQKATLYKVLLE